MAMATYVVHASSGGSDQMMSELDQSAAVEKSKKEMDDDDGLRVEGLIEEDRDRRLGDREEGRGVTI